MAATHEQVDFVHALVDAMPDELALCRSASEVDAAVGEGRIASLMGMEGGHSIDSSSTSCGRARAGVRYMTLTHNENVRGRTRRPTSRCSGGLSDFGRDVVREMNRLGMFVDLSHVSDAVMRDALGHHGRRR